MVAPTGFEPVTLSMSRRRSNQLSHGAILKLSGFFTLDQPSLCIIGRVVVSRLWKPYAIFRCVPQSLKPLNHVD